MTTQLANPEEPKMPVSLTTADIRRYICPNATEQEAYLFLRLCQAQDLNPFLKEAYLIKYKPEGQATMVIGKEGFTKRAEAHPMFDGFKAGVITRVENGVQNFYPEASFCPKGETLIGGWAEVYRKDRRIPFRIEVALLDFDTGMNQWKKMPGLMIRKVALVSALREAFPTSFAGLYDAAEMSVPVDAETGEIMPAQAPQRPAAPPTVPSAVIDAAKAERQQEKAAAHAEVAATAYADNWKPADAQDLLRWALNNGYDGALLNKTLKMSLDAAIKKNGLLQVYGDLLTAKP